MAKTHSRHHRFFIAFAFGCVVFALTHFAAGVESAVAALAGFDSFALAYLMLMAAYAKRTSGADLRRHAEEGDEGTALILTLALAAVAASIAAVFLIMSRPEGGVLGAGLALAAVPLGWAVVHTLTAFRYAHLHYADAATTHLTFPGTDEPDPWDFLYFAFTMGMAVQTSDVVVATGPMRRLVLGHAVLAFFYNTVILALAVNAALSLAR
jgi:uncharacterized membrane protein